MSSENLIESCLPATLTLNVSRGKFGLKVALQKRPRGQQNSLDSSSGDHEYLHTFNGQPDIDLTEFLLKNRHLISRPYFSFYFYSHGEYS